MKERIITGVLSALFAGSAVFFLACGPSRSPLVKKNRVALPCQLILEGLYYDQKDKSAYASFGESCKYTLANEYCLEKVQAITDERDRRRDLDLCLAKMGK